MSEKLNRSGTVQTSSSTTQSKPVPMKLFSSWEVDRTPPNCIPRLCSLTLTKLVVLRPLPTSETSSVIIAVKMAGSRRTLRSNEIPINDNGLINTDLELHFSLQYPHFLKREENRLLIMIQRRKKYKNRTILGYKTLAEGRIDMAMVLQRSYLDLELGLFAPDGGNKENNGPTAKLTIMGIASQPVDELEGDRKKQASGLRRQLSSPLNPPESSTGKGRPTDRHDGFSDDEDDFDDSHSSDSPPDEVIVRKNSKSHPHNKNLKQKIVNLLKKFKQTEEGHRSEAKSGGPVADIDQLFDELEGLSDSEPDADTLSVGSFAKPVLPPFFASSKSLVQYIDTIPEKTTSDSQKDSPNNSDSWTEPEAASNPEKSPKLTLKSPPTPSNSNIQNPFQFPSKLSPISDQLTKILPAEDNFPDLIFFVSLETIGPAIYSALLKCNLKVLGVESELDLRVALPHIVMKVQKFCNNNAKTPPPICIVVIGSDSFLSAVAKNYVNQLSTRPTDWQHYFSFLYAPFSATGSIYKLLSKTDQNYSQNFNDYKEKTPEEYSIRIINYANQSRLNRHIVNLPIAEAMITYKESEESSQVFVPFISEVRYSVGYSSVSIEQEQDLSSSPPSPPQSVREEPVELQVDYWKGTVKSSIKAFFRCLTIQRTVDNFLAVSYTLKEQKKQKIMRLGKKKDLSDVKNQSMDGISRLVCLAKSQTPIKLYVDGLEWPAVKFFQVSAQWQSQVKNLPLLVCNQAKENV